MRAELLFTTNEATPAQAASLYASLGLRVVPLHHVQDDGSCSCGKPDCNGSRGKHPWIGAWQREASASRYKVRDWFGARPQSNVGLALGGESRLVAIDVDGPGGRDTLARWEADRGPLPRTLTSRSGRADGGEHRIFRVPASLSLEALANRTKVAPGIDVRATGGQIVVAPSRHASGARYQWTDATEPAELPQWLWQLIANAGERKADRQAATGAEHASACADWSVAERDGWPTMADRERRARAWLAHAEPAVSGRGGHATAMRVVTGAVRGFALDSDHAERALADWNARCEPPWSAAELRHKLAEAARVGDCGWGSKLADAPRASADDATPEACAAAQDGDGSGGAEHGEPGERPTIVLSTELHAVVDDASTAIGSDPDVYQRDGKLAHVVRVTEADAARERTPIGSPQIRVAPIPYVRERLTRAARWVRMRKTSNGFAPVPCLPSNHAVEALMARGQWPSVRVLVGVTEAPSMRPDGTVVDSPGWDAATGFLYLPSAEFPSVPETPTQGEANAALVQLCEAWAEFPWASDADRYAPVAAALTLLARPAIAGAVPAFVFDASTRGSGKTLTSDSVAMLATGRGAPRMTWPDNDAELEKALAAYALRGTRLICFDNVARVFGGAPLDKVLTAQDSVELRVLGRSEIPTLTWRALVLASGNNVTLGGDTVRRVLVARIEPDCENPEERTDFAHPDLLGWVRASRAQLVAAGLTVLRGFVAAGRPDQALRAWGSFERWAELVPAAIRWAGGPDLMALRPTVAGADDSETSALRTVLSELPRLSERPMSAKTIVASLWSRELLRGEASPDGFDELREAIEVLAPPRPGFAPEPRALSDAFRKVRRRWLDGRSLDSDEDKHAKVLRWVVRCQ